MEQFKKCSRCGEVLPTSSFYKNRSTKDGLQRECKTCRSAIAKVYNKKNRESINAYYRGYNQKKKSNYVYIIKSYGEDLYIGSCSNITKRISNHIRGHVPTTRDYMLNGEWTSIIYSDISEYVNTKEEREFVEYVLIEIVAPSLNKIDRDIELDDKKLEEKLFELAEDLVATNNFKIYKTNNKKGINYMEKMYYIINENEIDEYADDLSNFIDLYIDEEDEDEWE